MGIWRSRSKWVGLLAAIVVRVVPGLDLPIVVVAVVLVSGAVGLGLPEVVVVVVVVS